MSDLSQPFGPLLSDAEPDPKRLREMAFVDEVTGLPNRRHLLALADRALQQSALAAATPPDPQSPPPVPTGLCLLALQVPQVADLSGTMGLGAANSLITALAARLQSLCGPDTPIGHLGEGEFAVLLHLPTAAERGAALQQATAWQLALQAPVSLGNLAVYPLCRMGLALHPADGEQAHALLVAAQSARQSVVAGSGPACYQAASQAQALRALQLETGLRQALLRNELTLAYQPQVCLVTGQILAAEALLRWQSAEWGEVATSEFIPLAERSGLMADIGDWVIQQACQQIVRWRQAGLPALRVAVNLSPVQFQLGDLAQRVQAALADSGADPGALVLELTEQALKHGGNRVAAMLTALRARGIGIALDDFGTGASSLNSLRDLPISLVKIDRSFICDLTASPHSASVMRSVIQLAHALNIPVLAEGVETEGQLHMLLAAGCDRLQGYLFSPPVPAEDLARLLAEGHRLMLPESAAPRPRRHLLLVDDEQHILSALKRLFRRDGYTIFTAQSGAEGLELLARQPVDVILSDQRMPGMTGVDFLHRAKALHPDTIRMTLSGFTDLQSIIDAVNEGAIYKFLTKPWDDELLRGHVAQAFAQKEMADENRRLQSELKTASAEQAALNDRLARLLTRRAEQTQLIQAGAGSLHDLIDALPVGVVGIDPNGLLALANPQASRLLPALGGALGESALPVLGALLQALRAQPPGTRLPVPGAPQALGAWLGHLQTTDPARGEVLVIAPMGPHP